MLSIFNKDLKKIAILENAYAISYTKAFNSVWSAGFSLPLDDPKNAYCTPLNFVEITDDLTGDYIGLFRIMPAVTTRDDSTTEVRYECKHVITTLISDVLFRYHQTTNLTTRENIEYILAQQSTPHWRLGQCDFTRYFHYKWENENGLLGALFSITEPFDEPFEWTFDTQSYPWTLNLVRPATEPTCEIRLGKNLRGIEREVDPTNVVNRIYPLGAGEGVNQLDIRAVNGGLPFVENAESIAQYGLQSYVWVDRRFENAESLKASAEALLAEWSQPRVTYRVKAADLYELTGNTVDKFDVGAIVRVVDPEIGTVDARILSVKKPDLYGDRGAIELEIGNKADDASTTLADLQRRQQVNEAYAQGATNLLVYSYNDNADASNPAVIRFYIPDDMVNVNKLLLTYETTNFRAYSRATKGGGSVATSVTSGGGGAVVKSTTTSSGGSTTQTSDQKGSHGHTLFVEAGSPATDYVEKSYYAYFVDENVALPVLLKVPQGFGGDISTYSQNGSHTHTVSIPAHTHQVTIELENHSHPVSITLPNHTHAIDYGIYKLSELPSKVTIKVDENTIPTTSLEGENIDLTSYLSTDSEGRINRGWHTVEIMPDDLGRINAQLITQFFVQSHEGTTL